MSMNVIFSRLDNARLELGQARLGLPYGIATVRRYRVGASFIHVIPVLLLVLNLRSNLKLLVKNKIDFSSELNIRHFLAGTEN
jgi:hypothetical protein